MYGTSPASIAGLNKATRVGESDCESTSNLVPGFIVRPWTHSVHVYKKKKGRRRRDAGGLGRFALPLYEEIAHEQLKRVVSRKASAPA